MRRRFPRFTVLGFALGAAFSLLVATLIAQGTGPLSAQIQRALRGTLPASLGLGTASDGTNFLKGVISQANNTRVDIQNTLVGQATTGLIARADTALGVLDVYSSGYAGTIIAGVNFANLVWLRPISASTLLIGQTTGTATPIVFATSTAGRWTIDTNGHLMGWVDNTYDIGAAGATRPRTVYVGTSAISPVVNATTSLQLNGNIALTATAPTIASFGGSSPAAAVVAGSTTAAFRITVGGTAPGTTGTINLPTATTGWNCWIIDQTTPLDITRQTSSTTASVGITSTIAWTANDTLIGGCMAF